MTHAGPEAVARPTPFAIEIPEAAVVDLRERLALTRWPVPLHGEGWKLGTSLPYLTALLDHWRDRFDWRAEERKLNRYRHARVEIDGAPIHYVHLARRGAPAILLLHGWPTTFAELLELADRLSSDLEVVVPSLPGYIFSGVPDRRWFWRDVPRMLADLMAGLGHRRFIAHGSDVGGQLVNRLAVELPDRLIGIHVTQTSVRDPGERPLTDAEKALLAEDERWEREDAAYSLMQESRPMTLAYALTDSPAGLAAWIVEKLHEWTDLGQVGDLEAVWSRERILTLLSLYWFTSSIGTSFLSYYEAWRDPTPTEWHPTDVPAAFAIFAHDIGVPPREWADRGYRRIVRWTEVPTGGHFASVEAVDLLASEILASVAEFPG